VARPQFGLLAHAKGQSSTLRLLHREFIEIHHCLLRQTARPQRSRLEIWQNFIREA